MGRLYDTCVYVDLVIGRGAQAKLAHLVKETRQLHPCNGENHDDRRSTQTNTSRTRRGTS